MTASGETTVNIRACRAEGDCATNSQAKGPIPDEASESWSFSGTDEAIPHWHIFFIAEESFRFKYGARDLVRASCFFFWFFHIAAQKAKSSQNSD